ncbi:hypothetical protein [Luteimonas sp. A501]
MSDRDKFPVPTVLSREYAKEHSNKNFSFISILQESFSNKNDIWKKTIQAAALENEFRRTLAEAIGNDDSSQKANAKVLRFYIKTRIPGLKFWSTMFSAFIALFGFTAAFIALLFSTYSVSAPILAGALIAISALLATFKYFVDKRIFWYDYISEHLNAISE